ncbi:MAG: hypothetical protein HOP09_13455 [Hyphomicrobium sp.]|nr:hypothetical protein [Hyphomicrobium sp.]
MRKFVLAAAALAALASGAAGPANAGVTGGSLGGLKTVAASEIAQQVHWRPYRHQHHRWYKYRKQRHCVWRHGHLRCWRR